MEVGKKEDQERKEDKDFLRGKFFVPFNATLPPFLIRRPLKSPLVIVVCEICLYSWWCCKALTLGLSYAKSIERSNELAASYIWAMYYFHIYMVSSLWIGTPHGPNWMRAFNPRYYSKNRKYERCVNPLPQIFHGYHNKRRVIMQGVIMSYI